MAIDWSAQTEPDIAGREMLDMMRELFPVPRSLTGSGVRETLAILGRDVPVEVFETPSGTQVFDWIIPREWEIRGGWIDAPDGRRILDFADSTLHVIGHSAPIDATVGLDELRAHVFTDPDRPGVIPFQASYHNERWGFCMTHELLESLEEGEYRVVIDSSLRDGSLTSGEARIPGSSDDEFLLSTYVCHPALANDNLSGIVLLWALA